MTEARPEVDAPLTEDGLVEAVLVPPAGLVPVVLLAFLVVAAWAVLDPAQVRSPARPDLTLTSWQDGADALAARRDATPFTPGPDDVAIARELAVWLALEATRGVAALARDPDARARLGRLEERVRRVGVRRGRRHVESAATAWARSVRAAFEADLRAAKGDAESWFARGQGQTHRMAPGLVQTLLQSGVASWWDARGGRLAPGARLVVEAALEQRYLALARRMPAPRPTLSTPLETLLLRYRVESHAGLTLRRRMQLAEQLSERDPAWPRAYATAVLMARAGKFRAARAWFMRAAELGERPDDARRNARWCRRQQRLRRR